jgi:hypothetical protein
MHIVLFLTLGEAVQWKHVVKEAQHCICMHAGSLLLTIPRPRVSKPYDQPHLAGQMQRNAFS